MLEVKKLSKYFGGVKAVNNCSFNVEKNSITALIGPNGSGKSTVFNLISGVLKEESGKIFHNKTDITHYSVEEVSNLGISRLFQTSQLFKNLTVKDNLLLAIDNEDTKFWINLLGKNKVTEKKVNKVKDILKLIDMESSLNILAENLSFGQQRLTDLGRAILNPHELLMLDEPVAGINPKLRKIISEVLLNLKRQGETILLIEHDMNFALQLADTVIVLDEGSVISQGTPENIVKDKKVIKAYLGD
ncbi:ABC transporter ATP-binding protein [Patescibacteria group bacterium]